MASQTQSMLHGAGYTCDFVEQPPNLFICEICKLVLRYPQITQCCGKNACRPCIEKIAENGAPCPIPGSCQNQCVKIAFNKDLHQDIFESRVYCSQRESGCKWTGTLENLELRHLQECPYLEEECQNSCGMKIQRRMVKKHNAICERFSVKCEQCGDLYERGSRLNHLDTCSFTKVKCPFSIVGCTAEMLNKDLQQHFEESLSDHYTLVAKQSEDMQAEIGENKALAQSKKKIKPLLVQCTEVLGLNDEVAAAEMEVIELQRALEEAQIEFKELEPRQSRVSAEVQQRISEQEASIHAMREEFNQLELMTKVRCYGPVLPFVHPANIVSRPLDCPVTTTEYIPQVSFTIPRFEEERKNDACLCLPPFYSHRDGYKMCLMVYCNGIPDVKGEYVSIYVRLLSGEHDRRLNWPLYCKVEIDIQSVHKGVPNVKKTIEVKSPTPVPADRSISQVQTHSCCLRVIRLLAGVGNEPVVHAHYLMDGCLTLDVVKVII